MDYSILIRLLLAHLLSDFVFQSTKWAKDKDTKGFSSKYLYWHILVTGVTASILVCEQNWLLPILIITAIHLVTDGLKGEINKRFLDKSSPTYLFIIDQFIHIAVIIFAWGIVSKQVDDLYAKAISSLYNQNLWFFVLAYVFVSFPSSILIGKMTQQWSQEINGNNDEYSGTAGLNNAGKWIGIVERIMILTFVLINQFAAIGFMLAAKSVLRFGDLKDSKDQKKTEYIIIGTFLSFMVAVFTGLFVRELILG